jgi:hypothetical protein
MNAQSIEQLFYRLKARVACDLDIAFSVNECKKNAAICFDNPLEINVSRFFLESPTTTIELVNDVLLHELAHAMVGPGEGHNDIWKKCARKIGCTSDTCVGPFLKKKDYVYTLTCPEGCSLCRLKVKKLNICRKHNKVMEVLKL